MLANTSSMSSTLTDIATTSQKKYSKSVGAIPLTATLVNMLLSTSPFSLPYALINGGLILGLLIFFLSTFLALNSADMMIESLGIGCALQRSDTDECEFPESKLDKKINRSPYFIKKKLELFGLSSIVVNKIFGMVTITFLCAFLIGSMLVKCVSSSNSLSKAWMFSMYGDMDYEPSNWIMSPYHFSILIFALITSVFALGNIEGSKILQVSISALRFLMIYWMILCSIYAIAKYGAADITKLKFFDFSKIDYLMSNLIFTTFMHHSVPGICYPLRPQTRLKATFIGSYVLHAIVLLVHCILAVIAFGERKNKCNVFPCEIGIMFNLNFLSLPIVGPAVQFFPALAIAVLPVLAITFRGNVLQLFGKSTTAVNLTLNLDLYESSSTNAMDISSDNTSVFNISI